MVRKKGLGVDIPKIAPLKKRRKRKIKGIRTLNIPNKLGDIKF